MPSNVIADKTKSFAIKTIKFCQQLNQEHCYVLANQILRSGTSIGANVRESKNAQSSLDFINKLNIALKEADETAYWLELLRESKVTSDIQQIDVDVLYSELNEIISILTKIIKTTKQRVTNN
ncbi:MAG: four helix bundle protein [Synergistaceae bacterium]|nr:four helix bundle protein [Synergistaceae bacterium]